MRPGPPPEGLAELFSITGDDKVKQAAADFIDNMIHMFEGPNGLWHMQYYQDTKTVFQLGTYARGQEWATKGLLAINRIIRNSKHLEKAGKLAEVLLGYQQSRGCWFTDMQGTLNDNGISEKGTALWSLLLYTLHNSTGDEKHLSAA